jgi:uncharacterized repeat protein (TIGR03803 family)
MMTIPKVLFLLILRSSLRTTVFVLALFCVLTLTAMQPARAQTFSVLHNFTGGADGKSPLAGLTMDAGGNLYGTTNIGGRGVGTVFKLSYKGSGWIFTPLYAFEGVTDGANPFTGVVIASNGILYGATQYGGVQSCDPIYGGCGTIYSLTPAAHISGRLLAPWDETVVYRFIGGRSGQYPSGFVFDQSGDIYGTAAQGGDAGCPPIGSCGTLFELTPSDGGLWTESTIYTFTGGDDGGTPAGVIFDGSGNLYGADGSGGYTGGNCRTYGCGVVYELVRSGSNWLEKTLYTLQGTGDGKLPEGGLIFDSSGNLYGTTVEAGLGDGTVFELTPSNGNWIFTVLYAFTDRGEPMSSLAMDAAGNLYGTTVVGGPYQKGSVFKLTPSNGSWTYTSLHDFTGGSDGGYPVSNVVFDASGNLYGTASSGGAYGDGVVWEFTP